MRKTTGRINRRKFLESSAKVAVASALLNILPEKNQVHASENNKNIQLPKFIIDSHLHCKSNEKWLKDVVEIYRPYNAMACVLTWIEDLEFMVDAMKSYPDIFIGYGRVNLDNPNAIREIEKFKKAGFVGMKFHSPQKNYDDPSYFQIYRLCEEYRLYMIFHTGISGRNITDEPRWTSSSRMRPMYLDTLCRLFPRVKIQGAHLGNPWYEEAAEAARWNPNLFFDVTGSTLLKFIKLGHLKRMSDILWWSSEEGEKNPHTLKDGPGAWEHIVFGTDEKPQGLPANIERFTRMLDENNVPQSIRNRMWGETMARNLGIDPETHKFIK
ncbi:MAG: amidohydrolase family protein [candidate division KSB1 bacterium]|jgi:predicted TIM-barrel fold metal-dependent hydrolase|nr:amidohydrolase family protein [candidate division KSB1 bacterium]